MSTYTSRASRFVAVLLLALGSAGMVGTAAAGATGVLGRSDSPAVVENAQIRAELIGNAPQGIGPGKPLWLGLQLRHATGWHTYWKNPGDSGLPTELQGTLPPGWQAASTAVRSASRRTAVDAAPRLAGGPHSMAFAPARADW